MSARQPLVSVIMPAYNAQETIGAAITGVLTQDYPRVELIVVDDGSTDRTQEICAAYGDLIRYRRVTNGGTASARNAGPVSYTHLDVYKRQASTRSRTDGSTTPCT